MPSYAIICLFALAGGFVQGLTGFGAGIVLMIGLPFLFPVVQASGMVQAICFVMTISIAWRYRASLRSDLLLKPVIIYVACSTAALSVAKLVNQTALKLALGIFLVALSVYFLVFQSGARAQLTRGSKLACIVASGVCDGLFGIGGPLMVVYYLSQTRNTEEYLGTLQVFFCVSSCFTLVYRVAQGLLVATMLPAIAAGAVFVLAGSLAAGQLIERLDAATVRRLTYFVIGLAGLYNAVTSAISLLTA